MANLTVPKAQTGAVRNSGDHRGLRSRVQTREEIGEEGEDKARPTAARSLIDVVYDGSTPPRSRHHGDAGMAPASTRGSLLASSSFWLEEEENGNNIEVVW